MDRVEPERAAVRGTFQRLPNDAFCCGTAVFWGRGKDVAADFYRADFMYKTYSAEQVREILSVLMSGKDTASARKGNLKRRI